MTDEEIEGFLDALVEDFNLEQLNDVATMKGYMRRIMGLKEEFLEPILAGAIHIRLLRQDQGALWQSVVKQRFIKH